MKILGIDTATWTASVGVCDGGRVIAERSLHSEGSHGSTLLPLIGDTLSAAGAAPGDLNGLAVSIGPGSFTGLRVGLATAKGLSLALNIPLVGVRTLPALALAAGVEEGLVCPLLDARKGEIYAALFEIRDGEIVELHHEVAVALDRWLPVVGDRSCVFIGDAVAMLAPSARTSWTVLPFDSFHPRGGVIARRGWLRLERGDVDDTAALEPFYVRPSEAELKAQPTRSQVKN